MNEIEQLRQIIRESDRIVFFGGAGVSTESNIPDFRSQDGLYNQKNQYPYPPEVMLSRSFFDSHPKEFFQFYFDRMIALDAVPNPAHYALAKLEKEGKLSAVITQNIDGLHQKAGSVNVLELHGSVLRNYCMTCGKYYGLEDVLKLRDENGIPRCELDQSIIKPDVVLYEEGLDQEVLSQAVYEISHCDTLIVSFTSSPPSGSSPVFTPSTRPRSRLLGTASPSLTRICTSAASCPAYSKITGYSVSEST